MFPNKFIDKLPYIILLTQIASGFGLNKVQKNYHGYFEVMYRSRKIKITDIFALL